MNQCEHGCNGCENCIDDPTLEQETERENKDADIQSEKDGSMKTSDRDHLEMTDKWQNQH